MARSRSFVVLSTCLWFFSSTAAQNGPTLWSAQPFNPPAFPIAVRSPYLNSWLKQGNDPSPLSSSWPAFWTAESQSTAWYSAIRVDGTTYQVCGATNIAEIGTLAAIQKIAMYTPTRTSFLFEAGSVDVNLTFLSPIEPTNLMRQSIPFTYVYMHLTSNDDQSHDIQVYSDISAEWISGDRSLSCKWAAMNDGVAFILEAQLETPQAFTENNFQAQDATVYMSMLNESGVAWEINADVTTRSKFNGTGSLDGTTNTTFRAINSDFPVFAISRNLGSIMSTDTPVVWGLGLVRDPVIQYKGPDGNIQFRHSYFWANYTQTSDVVKAFLNDFDRASDTAVQFDLELSSNASSISTQYADLVSLTVRQIFGSLDITISQDSFGNWNLSDVLVFMKGFDSIGALGNVNPVDTIFSAFPAFITLNPDLCKSLLDALLRVQTASSSSPSALHDLGQSYPNATRENINPANLNIEDNANMLIMILAHAQVTNDYSLITSNYDTVKQWADALIDESLVPNSQMMEDQVSVINQTSIAIKGIIGIGAMAGISVAQGNSNDAAYYANVSKSLFAQWEKLSISPDRTHILANYGGLASSYALMFDFYADRLLQLNLISDTIYDMQESFYVSLLEGLSYGPAYDSLQPNARSDYMLLTAATIGNFTTRNTLVSSIHSYASANLSSLPLSLEFDPSTGLMSAVMNVGQNSPAQGAFFSFLALNVPIRKLSAFTNTNNSTSVNSSLGSSKPSVIAGSIVGGVVSLTIVSALYWFWRRQRRADARFVGTSILTPSTTDIGARLVLEQNLSRKTSLATQWQSSCENSVALWDQLTESSTDTASLFAQAATSVVPVQGAFSETDRSSAQPFAPSTGRRDHSSLTPMASSSEVLPGDTSSLGLTAGHTVSRDRLASHSRGQLHNQTSSGTTTGSQVLVAKQRLVTDELRREVGNLRREMDAFREERLFAASSNHIVLSDTPPMYSF